MMTLEEPVFLAALSYARRNGVQLSIHIMGDRSIDAVLDWLSDVDPWLADVPSVRLEHASLLRPDQLERIDQMRLKPAFTTQIIFRLPNGAATVHRFPTPISTRLIR